MAHKDAILCQLLLYIAQGIVILHETVMISPRFSQRLRIHQRRCHGYGVRQSGRRATGRRGATGDAVDGGAVGDNSGFAFGSSGTTAFPSSGETGLTAGMEHTERVLAVGAAADKRSAMLRSVIRQ